MLYVNCDDIVNTLTLSHQEERMAKTATIQTRVDPEIKQNVQEILSTLNISMSEAISLYLTQITLNKGIPFEIKIPNKLTAKTLNDSGNGKELHKVSDVHELFQELNS
jgi:DNA-damage-inducible protein J